MKTKHLFLSVIFAMCFAVGTSAQTNTFYFMDEVPTRSAMNPAFMPNTAWYLGLPAISGWYFEGGTNVFAFKDLVMKNGNEWVTALHPSQNVDKLYNRIPKTSEIGARVGVNILNFGFRAKDKNYFTFDLGLKANANFYVPKDFFKLALYGTPDENGINTFNLKNVGVDAMAYGELGLGYMREINEKVTFGFKLKGLVGLGGFYSKFNKLTLNASKNEWNFDVQGDVYEMSSVMRYSEVDSTMELQPNWQDENGDFALSKNVKDYMQGFGGAIDLGVKYEPIKNLVISAAVTDLGFIRWNNPQNMINVAANGNFSFKGIEYKVGEDFDFDAIVDSIGDELKKSTNLQIKDGGKKFNQWLTANVNVGVEYGILKNKISFGALSNTRINSNRVMEEITLAVNFRPADWFKTYFSYTFFDGRYNNLGFGLSFRMGCVNTFLVLDYIPLNWVKTTGVFDSGAAIPLPYGTQKINIQGGLTLNFGRNSSDKDRDGIRNSKDRCKDTDIKALQALCPDVNRKDFVYKKNNAAKGELRGCTKDEDNDGVPDCYDKCPNTPAGVPVDEHGCPFDEDGDGVYDHLDKCPHTPAGVEVDADGCPFDTDGDGVPDYLDKCPNTPKGTQVDENGCPLDSDGDGVLDMYDKCPNTPAGVQVDENGCPRDTDGDGVPDYLDKCPGTPVAARGYVDENGCPKDSDGDGIFDYEDDCPKVFGVRGAKGQNGCPQVKASVKQLFQKALNGIQFETGKDVIKPVSFPILNDIVKVMKDNPTYLLQINGHTDNVGNADANQILSEKRANAVKNYLVQNGVAESRLTAQGFGASKPAVPNNSAANRAKNRRVEFLVTFEQDVPAE